MDNLLIALLLAGVLSIVIHTGVWIQSSSGTEILVIGIFINVLLAMFNLIPIPPLDGSRVVQYFLTPQARDLYAKVEQFGLLIIVALIFLVPGFQAALFGIILATVALIGFLFGISEDIVYVLQVLLPSN